ncbi:MAG: DUF4221 family protein [Bacteroidales bacterium]|nr:DUF4221 family protein [Bacteroidales bacterium]
MPEKLKEISFTVKQPYALIHNDIVCRDNDLFITFQNLEDRSLNLYWFDSTGLLGSYNKPARIFNNALFFQIFIKSLDSIVFYNNSDCSICIADSTGNILSHVKIERPATSLNPENYLYCNGNNIFFYNADQHLNVGIPDSRILYYKNVNPVIQLNLAANQHSFQIPFGDFPVLYKKNNFDFCNYFPNICSIDSNKTVISYAADDSLYIYVNGKIVSTFPCRSQFVDKFNAYPDDKQSDMLFYKQYLNNEPRYLNIVYDQFRKQFYRIVKHRFAHNKDKKLDTKSMTWSIIVLNSEFEKVKELLFQYQFFTPKIVLPSKDGIYIGSPYNPIDPCGKLTLTLFKF